MKFLLLLFILLARISNPHNDSSLTLTSPAFEDGKPIPARYTCDSTNISPPLSWKGTPANTKSFALIMDDPDAPMGTWVHWVMYNIPATVTSLAEGNTARDVKATEGLNSWEEKGYNGPCPDGMHRYHFTLYALDAMLNVKEGIGKEELLESMKGHVLGEATLSGTFQNL